MEHLDVLDCKILQALDQNARTPIAQLAKQLHQSRERIDYRLKQLVSRTIIRKFVCMINPGKLDYSIHKLYFKFQNLSKEKEHELIESLMHNEYVYWIASCQGKWDLNITVFANNIHHFDDILSKFISTYGMYILEQDYNETLHVGILSKDWLNPEQKTQKLVWIGGEKEKTVLDAGDVELLRILANNARMSAIDIGEKTGLTQRQVLYRIKRLEELGVILGYTTSLNLEVLGKQFFKAILYFNTIDKKTRARLVDFYTAEPAIGFFIFCVGGWSTEIELVVENNAEYYAVMERLRATFPDLKGYETIMFPREYKFDWMPLCYHVEPAPASRAG